MADVKGRYPLSTADGQSIPLDIVRPHGVISKTFATAASTAAMACPATIEMLSVFADQACILTFAASAADAAAIMDGTLVANTIIIPAGTLVMLTPPIDKKSFALRGVSVAGTAIINFYESWSGLALASQSPRR